LSFPNLNLGLFFSFYFPSTLEEGSPQPQCKVVFGVRTFGRFDNEKIAAKVIAPLSNHSSRRRPRKKLAARSTGPQKVLADEDEHRIMGARVASIRDSGRGEFCQTLPARSASGAWNSATSGLIAGSSTIGSLRYRSRQVRWHQWAGKRPADKSRPPNLRGRICRSDASSVCSIL
jgi:hypothetical protein